MRIIPFHSFKKKPQRGVVLLFVMGMIFLISIVVVQFLNLATREIHRRGRFAYEGEFRVEAMNALMLAMAVLHECKSLDKGIYSPLQGWGDPLGYAHYQLSEGWEGTVRVYDETGKLPLSDQTNPKALNLLFMELGFNASEASMLTDSLLDWMDTNDTARTNGVESSFYERLTPPYAAANGPLKSFRELYLVNGFKERFFDERGEPNERYRAFAQAVSFRRPKGYVNPNTASDLLLRTLAKLYNFNYEAAKARLDGPDGQRMTGDDQSIRSITHLGLKTAPPGQSLDWWCSLFRVEVVLSRGDVAYRLTVLLERLPTPKKKKASSFSKKNQKEEPFPDAQFFWGGLVE